MILKLSTRVTLFGFALGWDCIMLCAKDFVRWKCDLAQRTDSDVIARAKINEKK